MLQRILGRHVPDDPAITSDAEKRRREADVTEMQARARVAEAVARLQRRGRA